MSFTAAFPAYLPDVKYFAYLIDAKYFLFADHFQYMKRSSITRSTNLINDVKLTIPVIHNGYKKNISEKRISHKENWPAKHLKTIHHLYHKSPFFEDYIFEFRSLLSENTDHLNKLLFNITCYFLDKLKINSHPIYTSEIEFGEDFESDIINFAKKNKVKKYLYKSFEKDLLNENQLVKAGIQVVEQNIDNKSNLFNQNILEFLFTYGSEAAFLIRG